MENVNDTPVYDSAHRGPLAIDELREIFRYRDLLFQLVRRDVLTRYKRSTLGIAWTMLNPLGTMLIMSIVFSRAFGQGKEYAAYILSGLVAWIFFSQTTNAAMVQLLWGEGLLKRIYVPRTVFAFSAVGVGLVNIVLALVPLLVVMLFTGVPIRWTILLVPIPVLFLALFALGIGLLVSSLAVYYADVAEMYQILLVAWMYLSPILYTKEYLLNLSSLGIWIARLNPMFHLVTLFRAVVYDGLLPTPAEFLIAGGIALVTVVAGWLVFTHQADEFAYRL
jgi:ABC-type polysaccharide/polyol phosphate export permease